MEYVVIASDRVHLNQSLYRYFTYRKSVGFYGFELLIFCFLSSILLGEINFSVKQFEGIYGCQDIE